MSDLSSKLTPITNSSPSQRSRKLSKHQYHDVLRVAIQPSLYHSWSAEQCIITRPGRQCHSVFSCCGFTDLPVRIGTWRICCSEFVKMRVHIITIQPITSRQASANKSPLHQRLVWFVLTQTPRCHHGQSHSLLGRSKELVDAIDPERRMRMTAVASLICHPYSDDLVWRIDSQNT